MNPPWSTRTCALCLLTVIHCSFEFQCKHTPYTRLSALQLRTSNHYMYHFMLPQLHGVALSEGRLAGDSRIARGHAMDVGIEDHDG